MSLKNNTSHGMTQEIVVKDSGLAISLKRLIGLCLFSIVLFLNYNLSSDYISLLCTLLACWAVLTCKTDKFLPLALFFSSFAYLFRFTQYNIYFLIQICFIVRSLLIKSKILRFIPLFFFYVIVHLISTDPSTIRIGTFIPYISMFSLLVASCLYKEEWRSSCIQYLLFGFLISSILGLGIESNRLLTILDENPIMMGNQTLFHRFGGLLPDCNFYTMFSVVVISIVALPFNAGISGKLRVLLLFALLMLGGITFSKSFYLSIIALFALMLVSGGRGNIKFVLGLLFVGTMLYHFLSDYIDLVLDVSFQRFLDSQGDAESFTNGRYDYWLMYLREILSSTDFILVGHGAEALPHNIVAHNTYLEILYKFGALGMIFNIIFMYVAKKNMVKNLKHQLFNYIPFLFLLALIFNLSAFSFYPLWSLFFVCFIAWNTPCLK